MNSLSYDVFLAALATLSLAFLLQLVAAMGGRSRLAFAGAAASGGTATLQADGGTNSSRRNASILAVNGFIFLSVALVLRAFASGHGPFTSMFEFSLAFAWGVLALLLFFERRYRFETLAIIVLPVAIGLLAYAATIPSGAEPLVPALQNQFLLTVHVAVAIIAYGAFTVAFAAAVLYLVQRHDSVGWLPRSEVLDEVAYRSVLVGFPLLALTILLGAIWAEIAWGTYWSWDPKETASLATWLIYGGYLHARVVREWRGQRSAYFLIGGFAATLFTYYGNLFFGGLHGYA
ncbi:MAG: c-type cytochrome biogenesis protein CcsB [Anaerolineaceae bacterium]